MANWMGWRGPLFERPVTGAHDDEGGGRLEATYTETVFAVQRGDKPGRYHALIHVRVRAGFRGMVQLPEPASLRNLSLDDILAYGRTMSGLGEHVVERASRQGREMKIERTGPHTGGEGGYTYRSGGAPDPDAPASW